MLKWVDKHLCELTGYLVGAVAGLISRPWLFAFWKWRP